MNTDEFEKLFPEGAEILNKENVYIDNNIFVSIENGTFDRNLINKIVGSNNYRIDFSDEHIYETDTITDYDGKTKSERIPRVQECTYALLHFPFIHNNGSSRFPKANR